MEEVMPALLDAEQLAEHVPAPLPEMAPFSLMHDEQQHTAADYTLMQANGTQPAPLPHSGPSRLRMALNILFPLYFLVSAIACLIVPSLIASTESGCRTGLRVYVSGCGVSNFAYFALSVYLGNTLPNDVSDLALVSRAESVKWMFILAFKQLLGMADFAWFINGNWTFFRSDVCPTHTSPLYRLASVCIAQGYIGLVVPFIAFGYLGYKYPEYVFPSSQTLQSQAAERARANQKPASKEQIDRLVSKVYDSATTFADHHDSSCAICMDAYTQGQTLRFLPCEHHYHAICVDEWLSTRSATCPLCKCGIEGKPAAVKRSLPSTNTRNAGVAPLLPENQAALLDNQV